MNLQPTEHDLKTWPEPFEAVYQGFKSFEFRKDDRDYKIGDVLLLREWTPPLFDPKSEPQAKAGDYTGRRLKRKVTYLLRGPDFGIPKGYVVMSISPVPPVHILYHGLAMCGRIGTPREWPEGEKWVRSEDAEHSTCAGCLAVMNTVFPTGIPKKRKEEHEMVEGSDGHASSDGGGAQEDSNRLRADPTADS